ncbi:hypothetical protein Ae201684_009101 [Aphanomyces euteiches]|uniref:Uncharacterized protein n=1 Tax=Aphanomyces euteiches TaxID=100861 RepID=A0A6G0X357_9STRA|nr:hypothetical protein Ae201684_009101 [Aphanomyces euteiches]
MRQTVLDCEQLEQRRGAVCWSLAEDRQRFRFCVAVARQLTWKISRIVQSLRKEEEVQSSKLWVPLGLSSGGEHDLSPRSPVCMMILSTNSHSMIQCFG